MGERYLHFHQNLLRVGHIAFSTCLLKDGTIVVKQLQFNFDYYSYLVLYGKPSHSFVSVHQGRTEIRDSISLVSGLKVCWIGIQCRLSVQNKYSALLCRSLYEQLEKPDKHQI